MAAFFSLIVAIIFLISAIAFPGFRPYRSNKNNLPKINNLKELKVKYMFAARAGHLRTGLRAVHDSVAAVERERVLQLGQTLLCEIIS